MCLYMVLAILIPCCYCSLVTNDFENSLKRILELKKAKNTTRHKIPSYMFKLYQDTGSQQYDVIRSIPPSTETLGGHSLYVFDLTTTEPTEVVQKVELQLEPNQNYRYSKGINISLYSLSKQSTSKTYLGSGNLINNLDLADILGSHFLDGLTRLGVQIDEPRKPSIGLVLYSKNTAVGYAKAHELARLLFETSLKFTARRKRSLDDNEVDIHVDFSTEENKSKKKRKKTKINRLQTIDSGDSILITNSDQCRMEKLVLNFADIGWEDWVIYPKGFETNYCTGGCLFPLGKNSRPTNHATVQSLARSFGKLWDIPEPSCVPDTLAPLTLLYMDHSNHVMLKSYPDMKVLTCSCK
ncbi:bone morphogenetic protein 3-like [Daktulosphaira vitifoliae]|uniref:bone morphogenetic protein 3-like n=1 Tax=Daktulosphaira vitifoliae TaxID=58002 RepID=UPI0021AAD015|nr:bone morphogenetic protein 3-like [Daktulosphaira vitifoliae]